MTQTLAEKNIVVLILNKQSYPALNFEDALNSVLWEGEESSRNSKERMEKEHPFLQKASVRTEFKVKCGVLER